MSTSALPKAIQSLEWLLGKWKAVNASVVYPTMKTVLYSDEVEFSNVGQPILIYRSVTSHAEKGTPMHSECGFLRMKPDSNHVAFFIAHTFGVTEVSEGEVNGKKLTLTSNSISRSSFAEGATVLKLQRTLELTDDGILKNTVFMETSTQPLQLHLTAEFRKVEDK